MAKLRSVRYESVADANGYRETRKVEWNLTKLILYIVLGVIILAVIVGLPWACAGASAVGPMDKHVLVYEGGPLDGRNYIKQLPPGVGRFWKGNLNNVYMYPSTERTYIISKAAEEGDVPGSDFISAKTRDGNAIQIQVALTFHMVPENMREFHERLGLKYAAWTEQGWDKLLQERIRQPVKMAFQEEAKNYSVIDAISETGMLAMAEDVGSRIQREIDGYMGGNYIIVGELSLIDIDPDAVVQQEVEQVAASKQAILTATNRKLAAEKTAEANTILRESLEGEGGMTAVLQKAVESGMVKFWVLPSDMQLVGPSAETVTP